MGHDPLDAALLAVRGGHRGRFREVVEQCEGAVRVVLAAMVPDRSQVDDMVHEVFITAYLKLGDYQPGSDGRAWFKAIARNLALNSRRRWLTEQEGARRYRAAIEESASSELDQLAAAASGEILRHLRECIDALSDRARPVLEAYYFRGTSCRAIAEAAGRPEPWVRLMLFRARAALARCLEVKGAVQHG